MAKALRNAAAFVISLAVRALLATVRYRATGFEGAKAAAGERGGFVLAIWHEAIMVGLGHEVRRGATALVSPGKDGTFAARLVGPFGVASVRGSSSRGGAVGTRALLRTRKRGGAVVVTPDGPRGPRRVAQEGVAFVASRAGIPVVPVGVAVSRAWRLKSWDRFLIPKPFATARLVYGAPLSVGPEATREELAAFAERVGAAGRALTAEACADLSVPDA